MMINVILAYYFVYLTTKDKGSSPEWQFLLQLDTRELLNIIISVKKTGKWYDLKVVSIS